MKKKLASLWAGWKKLGLIIGDFVSTIIMGLFYFTIFALAAIPFRIFSRAREGETNFLDKKSTLSELKDFESE